MKITLFLLVTILSNFASADIVSCYQPAYDSAIKVLTQNGYKHCSPYDAARAYEDSKASNVTIELECEYQGQGSYVAVVQVGFATLASECLEPKVLSFYSIYAP